MNMDSKRNDDYDILFANTHNVQSWQIALFQESTSLAS